MPPGDSDQVTSHKACMNRVIPGFYRSQFDSQSNIPVESSRPLHNTRYSSRCRGAHYLDFYLGGHYLEILIMSILHKRLAIVLCHTSGYESATASARSAGIKASDAAGWNAVLTLAAEGGRAGLHKKTRDTRSARRCSVH